MSKEPKAKGGSQAARTRWPATQPKLTTSRFCLQPFEARDASDVQRLAGDARIATMTTHIPHPYPDGMAETWIAGHPAAWQARKNATFAIRNRQEDDLVGCISLGIDLAHARAELGYWIGPPFWGDRVCTEAAAAMLEFGFDTLELHRIEARHLVRNPASGAVMKRIGMQYEGVFRDHVIKDGRFEDMAHYAMSASDARGPEASQVSN